MEKEGWISQFDTKSPQDYLTAVQETISWLEAAEHTTEDGTWWESIPGKETDKNATLTSVGSLYGGSAGIAFFYLRMYQVTKNEEYLKKAESGIAFSIKKDRGEASYQNTGEGTLKGIPSGILNGPSGVAYVSYLLYEETGKKEYFEFTQKATELLIKRQKEGRWSGAYGILADGGLVLYLLWLYKKTNTYTYLEAADKAGKWIAGEADETDTTARWLAMDSVSFGLGEKGYFPGFFYGTAGTGYIMAKLYEETKKERYLQLAKKAAGYLQKIATVKKDGTAALIRYNDPYAADMYYLGMCQGPVGHSRLFYQLYKLTKEDVYQEWMIRLTNGILEAGAPKMHSKGYWHTYCYCCGAAGMLEHFLEMYEFTKDPRYEAAAKEAAEVLLRDSNLDEGKRRWYTAWNRHLPGEVEAWTGLYHGSTGCAASLLYYYNHLTAKTKLAGYLEDPFAL